MLELNNVSHIYPNGTRALDNVTLSIPHGMFGLLGPNGAGKSTLMRAIATLQVPSEGTIRFGDLDILAHPDLLRRKLGYLPQDFGVYPQLSSRWHQLSCSTKAIIGGGKMRAERMAGFAKRKRLNERLKS